MTRDHRIQLFLAAMLLLPLLTACSSASVPEPVTITFVVVPFPWWLSSQPVDYERLAEAFHEANPHVTVQVKTVGFDELPQGLADADFLTDPEWGVDVLKLGDRPLAPRPGGGCR